MAAKEDKKSKATINVLRNRGSVIDDAVRGTPPPKNEDAVTGFNKRSNGLKSGYDRDRKGFA